MESSKSHLEKELHTLAEKSDKAQSDLVRFLTLLNSITKLEFFGGSFEPINFLMEKLRKPSMFYFLFFGIEVYQILTKVTPSYVLIIRNSISLLVR